jgi:ATP synthase F1 delta subunit
MASNRKELTEAVLAMSKRESGGRTAKAVAAYLVDQRRTKELHALTRSLEELQYKQDGILEVAATSATPLSTEAKREITKLFPEAKQVRINESINQELRGGVQVRALDKVADFSVQARLRKLRQGVN